MAPFVTSRENGVITVSPKNEAEQSGLVVISHGLGDTAEGFVDVAEVRKRKGGFSKKRCNGHRELNE